MPPDSKSDLGEARKRSHKKSKPNLKITHDDHRLTINLVDKAQNQKRNDSQLFLNDSFNQPLLLEPPLRVDSLQRRKKSKKSKNCLNIFDNKQRSPSPEITPESYKHLKEIISEANDSWSYLFLPIIHLANIDPTRLKTNKLIENFNNFKKQFEKSIEVDEKPKRAQISVSDSNLNNVKYDLKTLTYDEKHSSSSSGSCSEKVNKLDALKNEIDKTINEINTFKNEIINHESRVQTVDIGINTDISMSNAVFKIKYEDEEDEEFDDTTKNSNTNKSDKMNYSGEPFVESPSETNSARTKHIDLPALTLIKNLNKKYNISSVNETDFSSPGLSRKNSKTIYKPKITQFESDSLDDHRSKINSSKEYFLDDDNIFKKIFSRNLEQKANYINLEPIKKKDLSSSSITSSSSDSYRRTSKVFRKRESLLINEESKTKRHSLKKLPVVDFAARRLSNEYKLKILPLKRSVTIEPTRFHCCCCKCSCTEAPVYQTVTTTTMAKMPTSVAKINENSDTSCTSIDSDKTPKSDDKLNSYYFKSTKNHRKKNEFGLLSHDKDDNKDEIKRLDFNSFLDDLEKEKKNFDTDNDFDFIKNLLQSNEDNDEKLNGVLHEESEDDFSLVTSKFQYILDSLHRPHSAFQFNDDRLVNNYSLNTTLNEFDFNTSKSYRNQLVS